MSTSEESDDNSSLGLSSDRDVEIDLLRDCHSICGRGELQMLDLSLIIENASLHLT